MTIAETAKNMTFPQIHCAITSTSVLFRFRQGDETSDARRAILIEQRGHLAERIAQMQQALERLDRKIAHCEKCAAFEHTLRDGEAPRK